MAKGPLIGIVMGSDSDWPVLEAAHKTLNDFGVALSAFKFLGPCPVSFSTVISSNVNYKILPMTGFEP